MTNAEILEKAGFRETSDEQWLYSVELRKAFNGETQRDATTQWVEKCLAVPVPDGIFEFYFWTGGTNAMPGCKALLNQLRRSEMIVIKNK
jgi:hypothetical protein